MASANARQCPEKSVSRGQTEEEGEEYENGSDCGSTSSSFNSSDYSE